jgi:peptidyl-prolyl cis-trans isomerase D
MLETLREQRRNKFIYGILGVIIVVFVLFFGPQSSGFLTGSATWAGRVDGREISDANLLSAMERYTGRQRGRLSDQDFMNRKRTTLQDIALVHLLARRAEGAGLAVSQEEVRCYIVGWHDDYHVDGEPICRRFAPESRVRLTNYDYMFYSEEGIFSKSYTQDVRGAFGQSVGDYEAYKRDELLALHYLDWLAAGIVPSREVVLDVFERRNTKVDLEYVSLDPAQLTGADISDAEAEAWAAGRSAEIEAKYNANPAAYATEAQVKLSRIYLRKPGADDAAGLEEARKKYETALKRTRDDKEDFSKVVEELTELDREKESKGDMGFRTADTIAADIFDAVKDKAAGEIVGVEQSFAFNVIRVDESKPAGNRPLPDVRLEIAKELMKAERTASAATTLEARGRRVLELAATQTLDEAVRAEASEWSASRGGGEGSGEAPAGATLKSGTTGAFAREGKAQSFGTFRLPAPPADQVQGIGKSRELVRIAFALTKEQPLHPTVIDVEGVPYIVRLKERTEAANPPKAQELREVEAELRTELIEQILGSPESRLRLLVHDAAGQPEMPPYLQRVLDDAEKDGSFVINEKAFRLDPSLTIPAAGSGSGG